MYSEMIGNITYSIITEFGVYYPYFQDTVVFLTPVFLALIGVKLGVYVLRNCIDV